MKRLQTPDDVNALLSATIHSAALSAAIETRLLWTLAEQPMSANCVAETLSIPIRRCRYWLQLLESLGILDDTPEGYAPTALAREAILGRYSVESWVHLAVDERERTAGVHNLAEHISTPGSIWTAQGLSRPTSYVQKIGEDPARAREFTRMLYEVHLKLADELAGLLDLRGARRLLDVGGGSGVVSMAFLRRYPFLTAVVVDQESVCAAGREIAAENGLSDRLEYCAADVLRDELPGGFDVALQRDVGVFDSRLYAAIWAALKPGGCLIMADQYSPSEERLHPARLAWSFIDSLDEPEFYIPTVAQMREMLARTGFAPLPGETVLSTGRLVIWARKLSSFGAFAGGTMFRWKLAML